MMHAVNVHKGMYARYTLMLTRVALAPHTQILHISAFKLKFSVQNDPEEVCVCGGGVGGGRRGNAPPSENLQNEQNVNTNKKKGKWSPSPHTSRHTHKGLSTLVCTPLCTHTPTHANTRRAVCLPSAKSRGWVLVGVKG
jgi:hypothetical protein